MAGFATPNDKQKELILDTEINPDGMAVIHENEDVLMLKHHKSGNEIMIIKGFTPKRREQNGN